MNKYTDEFISNEIIRCKSITGVPTTLRQVVRLSKLDKGVFDRYLLEHPDPDLLKGEEEKIFNKKMFLVHKQETFKTKYNDPNYGGKGKKKPRPYNDNIKEEIQNKLIELNHPVTSLYLSKLLPYGKDTIEKYALHYNMPNMLYGNNAKIFNYEERHKKLKEFIAQNPEKRKERVQKKY